MKSFSHSIRAFFAAAGGALKKHHQFLLFVLFIAAIGMWGILFLEYGWKTVYEQPEVIVRTVKIKTDDLKTILADVKRRAELKEAVQSRAYPNPFIEPPKAL